MRIAICDGDSREREKHLEIFQSLARRHNIEAEFVLYSKCEEMLFGYEGKKNMDVLITDIQMPGMSGNEAAEKLRKSGYKGEIIFFTSLKDEQYILAGYDVGALHYIIKGQTPLEKIEEVFLRAKEAADMNDKRYILFTGINEWINIPVSSIRYFEIYRKIVSVYYGDETFSFHAQSFESIKQQLSDMDFIKTHRSYLVALKEIKQLTFHTLTTRNGKSLPVGRTHYFQIKEALENFEQIHTII